MMEHNQLRQPNSAQIILDSSTTEYQTHVLSTTKQCTELEAEWRSLQLRDGRNELCMSFEWLSSWLAIYLQPDDQLLVVAIFREQRLVFLAPLYLRPRNLNSWRHRTLQFIGCGEAEADEVASEFQDFLLDKTRLSQQQAFAVLNQQVLQQPQWHFIQFNYCCKTSLAYQWLNQLPAAGRYQYPVGIRYQTPLHQSWHQTRSHFPSANSRKHAQKALNRLTKPSISVEKVENEAQRSNQLNNLIRLHQSRWQARNQAGVFQSDAFCRFHQDFSHKALERGWLAMYQLSDQENQQAIAVLYCLKLKKRRYYYQSGFDQRYAQLSPVTMLHMQQLQEGITAGEESYDWMCGKPDSYKKGFACACGELYHCILYRHNIRGTATFWLERLKLWAQGAKR